MPLFPTPTGSAPSGNLAELPQISADSSLSSVVAALNEAGFSGAAFQTWYEAAVKKDHSLTPYQGVSVWIGSDLAKSLGTAVTGTGNAAGEVVTGAAQGADEFAKGILDPLSWLGGLSVVNLLKIVFGGTLLLVGIVHLAGIDSGTVATIARKVPIPV
jgi:hypothetical protein